MAAYENMCPNVHGNRSKQGQMQEETRDRMRRTAFRKGAFDDGGLKREQ